MKVDDGKQVPANSSANIFRKSALGEQYIEFDPPQGYTSGGPYRIPAVRIVGRSILSNTVPSTAFRGFGNPQQIWAVESNMDEAAKELGLNMLRCHIKVNDPRYYYWADKLGLLIMYDLPSASVYTPKARASWEQTLREERRKSKHLSIG